MSALPPVLSMRCPWCDVEPGQQCVRPSGATTSQPHRRRWLELSAALFHDRAFIVEVNEDDPHINLAARERYAAIRYWLDPGAKVTLLRRVTDDYQPNCNLYLHQGKFIEWEQS